jgi:hypothetical protein
MNHIQSLLHLTRTGHQLAVAEHPPRPGLTLNVGITGHRASMLPPELCNQLRPILDEVLCKLRDATRQLHGIEADIFAPDPPRLRLHSPLATGADQMAASSARANGYHLRALLPFAPDDYRADFKVGPERLEFDRQLAAADEIFALPCSRSDEEGAYVMVGKAVVAAADILVAIWDGRQGNGPGGTAHVIDLALANRVPVIHVAVDRTNGETKAPRLLVGGDAVEPLEQPFDGPDAYFALVQDTLSPHTLVEREQLSAYFGEREKRTNWRIEYPLLLAMLRVRSLGAPWRQSSIAQDIAGDSKTIHGGDGLSGQSLDQAYGWANFLAIRYAQLFRSGHVTNYALSALAVILALTGLIFPTAKVFLVIAELGAIGLLFLNTKAGTEGEWHRRWLQYRHLAESLRPLYHLKRTGMINTPFRSDFIRGPLNRNAGADWTRWYAAAVWRQMEHPRGILTDADIRRISDDVLSEQIVRQAEYHQINADRMHLLDHRLHEFGNFLMGAVIASCVLYVVGYVLLHEQIKALTGTFIFLTAGLPAIGAAVFGMRGHGEHLLAASRSASTAAALKGNSARLEGIATLEGLAAELESTASNMLADLNEWAVAYSERSLEIPA